MSGENSLGTAAQPFHRTSGRFRSHKIVDVIGETRRRNPDATENATVIIIVEINDRELAHVRLPPRIPGVAVTVVTVIEQDVSRRQSRFAKGSVDREDMGVAPVIVADAVEPTAVRGAQGHDLDE